MDVSEGILANLDAGNPCRHDDDLHFHLLSAERKLMNHYSLPNFAAFASLRHRSGHALRRDQFPEAFISRPL